MKHNTSSEDGVKQKLQKLEVPKMVVWIDKKMKVDTTQLTEKTVGEILEIFKSEKDKLLAELLERLPESAVADYDPGELSNDEMRITKRDIEERVWGWNNCSAEVKSVIESMIDEKNS